MDKSKVNESVELIDKHFELDPDESKQLLDSDDFSRLEEQLSNLISFLLDNDLQRLLNGLYRIDVDEQKFKEILAYEKPEKVSLSIARLIIERELKKVETRRKYKGL